jgi:acetyltransferase
MKNAAKHAPEAEVDGVFVQKMLDPGLEVIIGANNDPQFGPAVLVGLGGIFVEVFRDTVLRPAPFTTDEARQMLAKLKAFPLFNGYRGQAELDVEALAEAVAGVAKLAADKRNDIVELDVNPVFVSWS